MSKIVVIFLTVWAVLFYLLLQFPLYQGDRRRTLKIAGIGAVGGMMTAILCGAAIVFLKI